MAELASGVLAMRALKGAGVEHLFTLSGGHIFPLYEGCRDAGVRIIDTRHEQTATFAAEGLAKLTRRPQVAALTAGPGVTNGASAVAGAKFNGSPVLVIGGRAPQATWGAGSLQEMDHVAFMQALTKHASTSTAPGEVARDVLDAFRLAGTAQRGPTFVDIPMDVIFLPADEGSVPAWNPPQPQPVDVDAIAEATAVLREARKPVVIAGTDVWFDGAWQALGDLAETLRVPVIMNGMGRGCLPADHELAFSRARGKALKGADVVVVIGTPLDFRLGFGHFGDAQVVHVVAHPDQVATHRPLAAGVSGNLAAALTELTQGVEGPAGEVGQARAAWVAELRGVEDAERAAERELLESDSEPIHPARVYGELGRALDRDAVVIGDGGDFVSYAGKYVQSYEPGHWMDPGPYGCLGTGQGYATAARLAHPGKQVALMLGDGAAGFSLMDVDTLVRHNLPVVMIVGNNGMWALEKYPMQQMYGGWDVAADLRQDTGYDEIVQALGGAGETVSKPGDLAAALRRGFDSGVPYLVNVLTDPKVAYPRKAALV
jgi:acetolactate synthase-1/2/3 large subunit